jgi:hypothetical protein
MPSIWKISRQFNEMSGPTYIDIPAQKHFMYPSATTHWVQLLA